MNDFPVDSRNRRGWTFYTIQGWWGDIRLHYKKGQEALLRIQYYEDSNGYPQLRIGFPIMRANRPHKRTDIFLPAHHVSQIMYTDPEICLMVPAVIALRLTAEGIKKITSEVPENATLWQEMLDANKKVFRSFTDLLIFVLNPAAEYHSFEENIPKKIIGHYPTITLSVGQIRQYWRSFLMNTLKWPSEDCENLFEILSQTDLTQFFPKFALYPKRMKCQRSIDGTVLVFKYDQSNAGKTVPIDIYEQSDESEDEDDLEQLDMEKEEILMVEYELRRQNGECLNMED